MNARKEEFPHVVEDPPATVTTPEEDTNAPTFHVHRIMFQKVDANIDVDLMTNQEDVELMILHVFVAQYQFLTIFLLSYLM